MECYGMRIEKRGILLFGLIFALASKSAYALEVNIGSKSYPAFIFIPLLLIALVWVLMIARWVFRHFKGVSLFFFNLGRFISEFGPFAGIRKLREKLKEKQEEEEKEGEEKKAAEEVPEAKRDLSQFPDKIAALEKQLEKSKDDDEVFRSLTGLIRDFFAALLNMHYAFTEDEMVEVLKKKKKNLVDFAQKISEIKYSGKKPSKKEIEALLKEFRAIAHRHVEAGWKPKRVARGVIERLAEQDKRIVANVRQYVDFLKHENRKQQIESLLEDEQEILNRNVSSMKKTYNRILEMYVNLSPNEKATVCPQLVAFYNNANKAIFSSVYGEKSRKELEYFVKELQRLKTMPRREPWLVRLKNSFTMPNAGKKAAKKPEKGAVKPSERGEGRLGAPATKAPEAKVKAAAEELPKIKPLFDKLLKVFRPEEISEKKAKKMLKPKAEKKVELKEPSLKPITERFGFIKSMFRKPIPTTEIKIPKPSGEGKIAIDEIGKLLESAPGIQKVDYAGKLNEKITNGWNLVASCDFDGFDALYEAVKLDFVNLSEEEQKTIGPKVEALYNAADVAKKEIERKKAEEEQEIKQREQQQAEKEKEKEEVRGEATQILGEIQHQLEEEEELAREEEELLKLEEERKKRQGYAARRKDRLEALKEAEQIDAYFKEQDELAKEEDELLEWADERKKRQALAEKRRQRLEAIKEAEKIDSYIKEQEELAREEEELLSWAGKRKRMHETAAKRGERLKALQEAEELDRAIKEQERLKQEETEKVLREELLKQKRDKAAARREKSEVLRELEKFDLEFRKKAKEIEKKEDKEKRIEEKKLRKEVEEHFRREELRRQNEEAELEKEEDKRRKELEARRKESEKLRAEKEKQWQKSMKGSSAAALENLEDQLKGMIASMDKQAAKPVAKEDMKAKLAREAEIVKREVEARRLRESMVKKAKAEKKKALSPIEQEELKLMLELERIKKGL